MTISDLVYDVGLHKGEDTDYYLAKGFNVIAFEADPGLAQKCRQRFAEPLRNGRLIIIEGAIAPPDHGDEVTFYCSSKSVWGTVDPAWCSRNGKLGASIAETRVKRTDFKTVLETYGVPFYIKIDVEGVDRHILETVLEARVKPDYISIESEKNDFETLEYELDLLKRIGYSRFRAVQQADIPGRSMQCHNLHGAGFVYTFQDHSSGPFADDVPQAWKSKEDVLRDYQKIFTAYKLLGDTSLLRALPMGNLGLRSLQRLSGVPMPGWYDTHAC